MGLFGIATTKEIEAGLVSLRHEILGDLNQLEDQVRALEGQVNARDEQIGVLEGRISALDGKIDQVITLFEPGDVDVFAGNNDWKITDKFDEVGGYFRDGMLVIWAEVEDDSLPAEGKGDIMFRINKPLPFRFAGIGRKQVARAHIFNKQANFLGTAKYDPGLGRFYVEVDNKIVGFGSGGGRSFNHPFSFHYGCHIRFEIEIP